MNRWPAVTTLLKVVHDLLEADVAYLKLLDADGTFRIYEHISLHSNAFRDHAMYAHQGLGGLGLRLGVATSEDYFDDNRFAHDFDEVVAAEGLRSLAVAVLPYRDGVLGLLYAGWRRPRRFSPFDVTRLGLLAIHAAFVVAAGKLSPQSGDRAQLPSESASFVGSELSGEVSGCLSRRQIQVLKLRSLGLTVEQIAEHLGISQHTVRFHLRQIMRKLQAPSEVTAIARAFRSGVLK